MSVAGSRTSVGTNRQPAPATAPRGRHPVAASPPLAPGVLLWCPPLRLHELLSGAYGGLPPPFWAPAWRLPMPLLWAVGLASLAYPYAAPNTPDHVGAAAPTFEGDKCSPRGDHGDRRYAAPPPTCARPTRRCWGLPVRDRHGRRRLLQCLKGALMTTLSTPPPLLPLFPLLMDLRCKPARWGPSWAACRQWGRPRLCLSCCFCCFLPPVLPHSMLRRPPEEHPITKKAHVQTACWPGRGVADRSGGLRQGRVHDVASAARLWSERKREGRYANRKRPIGAPFF